MFIASKCLMYPAPSGATCKLNAPKHIALRWSASYLMHEAINIVLLWSTPARAKATFVQAPFKPWLAVVLGTGNRAT